jgi:LysR family nitrogen assimilation transcriptional regulator
LIRRFYERWPKASLHVSEGLSTSLQEWLLDGRIQVAVVYNQPLLEAFDVRPIFSERMVLVGPPGETPKIGAHHGAGGFSIDPSRSASQQPPAD